MSIWQRQDTMDQNAFHSFLVGPEQHQLLPSTKYSWFFWVVDFIAIINATAAMISKVMYNCLLYLVECNILVTSTFFVLVVRILQHSFYFCSLPDHMVKAEKIACGCWRTKLNRPVYLFVVSCTHKHLWPWRSLREYDVWRNIDLECTTHALSRQSWVCLKFIFAFTMGALAIISSQKNRKAKYSGEICATLMWCLTTYAKEKPLTPLMSLRWKSKFSITFAWLFSSALGTQTWSVFLCSSSN